MREITIICWDGHSQEEKENRSVNLKRPTGFLRPAPEQQSTAEEHFAYLEDTDIGYRARLLGYENWYEPSAKVYHVGSGTSGSRYNLFKIRYSSRNNIYLIYKNMPVLQILLNLPVFILGFSAKLVFFASKGYGKEYLAGIKNGFFICRKPENRAKKIRFEWKRLGTYFVIEWELFINVFRRFLERA